MNASYFLWFPPHASQALNDQPRMQPSLAWMLDVSRIAARSSSVLGMATVVAFVWVQKIDLYVRSDLRGK